MICQFHLHRNMSAVRRSLVFILAFIAFSFESANAFSIGVVSDDVTDTRHIDKRAAGPELPGDIFPDWVPFKNKQGDELGEFVQVPKAKLKKRLALPLNFKLRSVAEPQDDYFDKVQAEGDADYFENKDWNGETRTVPDNKETKESPEVLAETTTENATTNSSAELQHKDISDIDGVVNIIQSLDPVSVALERNIVTTESQRYRKYDKDDSKEEVEISKEVKLMDNNEEDSDYDEVKSENSKEEKENDAKKAFILNSVDELKERHASEQKYISEKAKEEERFIEQLQSDTIWGKNKKKNRKPKPVVEVNYHDDYDDDVKTVADKYRIKPRITTSTTPGTTAIRKKTSTNLEGYSPPKKEAETAKLSVFRNPRLYMLYDEDETEAPYRNKLQAVKTITTTTSAPHAPKFSSRYVYSPTSSSEEEKSEGKSHDSQEEIERLAFVPEKYSNNGEPTLFFPKKLKEKKSKTNKAALKPKNDSAQESTGADATTADTTASGSTKSVSNTIPINFFTSPSIEGTASTGTASDDITLPSASASPFLTTPAETAPDTSSSDSRAFTASTGPTSFDNTGSGEEITSTGSETAPSGSTGQLENSIEVLNEPTTTERVRKTTRVREKTTRNYEDVDTGDTKDALVKKLMDLDASSTNKHKKEDVKEDGGDHEHESGGGNKYHTEHEEEHGEHGKKAYEPPTQNPSNKTKKSLQSFNQNTVEDETKQTKTIGRSKNRFKDEVLYRPNPWGITKTRRAPKASTIRRTTTGTTTTTVATTSTSTTRAGTTGSTTTRSTARSTPSTKSPASTARATARRARTTSTRKTNTRRKWSSSKRKAIRPRTKKTAALTTNKSTKRVADSKMAKSTPTATLTIKGNRDTSSKEDTLTDTRAARNQEGTTATASARRRTFRKRRKMAARNGSTTTVTQPRMPTSSS